MIDSPKIESEYNIIKWNAVAWSLGSMNICSRRTKVFSMSKADDTEAQVQVGREGFFTEKESLYFFHLSPFLASLKGQTRGRKRPLCQDMCLVQTGGLFVTLILQGLEAEKECTG